MYINTPTVVRIRGRDWGEWREDERDEQMSGYKRPKTQNPRERNHIIAVGVTGRSKQGRCCVFSGKCNSLMKLFSVITPVYHPARQFFKLKFSTACPLLFNNRKEGRSPETVTAIGTKAGLISSSFCRSVQAHSHTVFTVNINCIPSKYILFLLKKVTLAVTCGQVCLPSRIANNGNKT